MLGQVNRTSQEQFPWMPWMPQVQKPWSTAVRGAETCPQGMEIFHRLNHWDENKCFSVCLPHGSCVMVAMSFGQINKLRKGGCKEAGFKLETSFTYDDELDATLEFFPVCKGATSKEFLKHEDL